MGNYPHTCSESDWRKSIGWCNMQSALAARGETRRESEGLNFLSGADSCSGRRRCGGDAGPERPRAATDQAKNPQKRVGVVGASAAPAAHGATGRRRIIWPPSHFLCICCCRIWAEISLTWRATAGIDDPAPGRLCNVERRFCLLFLSSLSFGGRHPPTRRVHYTRCSSQCCRRLPNARPACLYSSAARSFAEH